VLVGLDFTLASAGSVVWAEATKDTINIKDRLTITFFIIFFFRVNQFVLNKLMQKKYQGMKKYVNEKLCLKLELITIKATARKT
jgi:hypothetical protein